MFLHRSLRQKKRARKGKTSGSAKLRHPCKHRWHTPCCAALTPLSLRLLLALGVPARFFRQAFTQSSPAATLAPKPFKVSLRSIFFIGVNRRLLLGSPAGREGVGLSQFLLVTLRFFAPALIQRCGSIRFFRYLNPLSSHILSTQRRACLHSLHYVPPIPLRYIKLHSIHSFDKPSSDPAKKLHSTQKLRQPSLGCHRTHCATLHSVLSASRPRSTRNGFALHFGGRESTPLSLRRFPTASLLKAVFPCAGERGVAIPNQNNC